MKVGIIGAGSLATAIAQTVALNVDEVILFLRREKLKTSINEKHYNSEYYPNTRLKDKVRTGWVDNDNCINGKIQLQNNGDLSGYLSAIKNKETIILKSDWKAPSMIKIELKSTNNQVYQRYASIKLYNDKNQCNTDLKTGIYHAAKSATETEVGQVGWLVEKVQPATNISDNNGKINISRQLLNKDYYLLVLVSSYYNELSSNCVSVKPNENKTIKLTPKTFKIKFDLNGGTGKVKTTTKTVDENIKVKVNNLNKNKYKFSYWIAKRTVNNETQYRCFNSKNQRGWYKKSECSSYAKYGTTGKDFNVALNTTGEPITFVAQWKK